MRKNEIREKKVREWEMKGHGFLAFPLPLSFPISSCILNYKGSCWRFQMAYQIGKGKCSMASPN